MKDNKNNNIAKIVAIAVGLPTNILGCAYVSMLLQEKGYISSSLSMILILLIIFINFYWMIRYAIKKTN